MPSQFEPPRIKEKNGYLLPQELECHIHGGMVPTIPQPTLRAANIWFIDKTGGNLELSLQDAVAAIKTSDFAWFDQFNSLHEVLRILLNEPEDMTRLHGFGRNPSPLRHYLAGYIALRLNDTETANQQLKNALLSGCFSSVKDRLAQDIQRTNAPTSGAS